MVKSGFLKVNIVIFTHAINIQNQWYERTQQLHVPFY